MDQERASPSALVRNMQMLGVSRDEIDVVFISHLHMDHVGGLQAQKARTLELTPEDPEPLVVDAYVPVEMSHASANGARSSCRGGRARARIPVSRGPRRAWSRPRR